jgi:Holliday junction resolvase RusA-like endonuclease
MKHIKLIIDGKLSGLNEYINACRVNRYKGAQMKKQEQERCMWHIKTQIPKKLKTPLKLSFLWLEPNMKRDLDNICFAKKFILDALVQTGKIPNDGWRDVQGFEDHFGVDPDNPRIEVDITYEIDATQTDTYSVSTSEEQDE